MLLNKKFLVLLFILGLILPLAFGEVDFTYDAKGRRNPFIPLLTPQGRLLKLDKLEATSAEGLSVEGIIYDKFGRSFAIVNASVLGIGDIAGDYQVLKILENKVIFIKDGEPLEVDLTNTQP